MQLHQLKSIHKNKKARRIGRGGKRGYTSGKGSNGQRSRASNTFQPIVREVIKKYPKLRGYKFNSIKAKPVVLNLEIIESRFESGEKINPQALVEKRIIRKESGLFPRIKILGGGEVKKSLVFEGCQISKAAREKIKKAGGEVK